ncbi:MAG: molybdate ABC transporter permease subunit [Polyangiales bacterium]
MDLAALALSLRLAAVTTLLLLALGLPLAWWVATSRSRARPLVEALVTLPLVLPPTVMGWLLLVALGPRTAVGRLWERLSGGPLAFSFAGLVVASVFYGAPFAVQPFAAAFARVDPELLDLARTLGAGRWERARRVVFPMARGGVAAGCALAFAHVLGEFGVVLMVGGNIPGVTRTLSLALYDDVQALRYEHAARTAAALLAMSAALLAAVATVRRERAWRGW